MKLWRKNACAINKSVGEKHQGRKFKWAPTMKKQAHPLVLALLTRFGKVGQGC